MKNQADFDHIQVLKTGTLPKTGGEYTLALLSAEHIDRILPLQDAAFEALSEQEQSFLLRKDRDFFDSHFAADNLVLGVIHEDRLIAQSVIVHPTADNPKTGMTDINLSAKADKITVLQGVVVHPDYRGNNLSTIMIDAWLETAHGQKRTDALAEVSLENFHSWRAFLNEGLQIHSIGTDPADGAELYNVHARVAPLMKRRLRDTFNEKSAKHTVDCPASDVGQQKELLAQGYKGVKYDSANGNIAFEHPKKKAKTPEI